MTNKNSKITQRTQFYIFNYILIFMFCFLILSESPFAFAQGTPEDLPATEEENIQGIQDNSPTTFYNQVNPKLLPSCAGGESGFNGVVNCVVNIIKRLQPIAAILLVLVITISGAYLIFSPFDEKKVQMAKTALFWGVVGFVIVLSADLIKLIVEEISGTKLN